MEKPYKTAEDFFSDESFQRYVLHSTPEDTAYWESWLKRHPETAEEAGQAVMMIQSMHQPEKDLSQLEFANEQLRFESFLAKYPAQQKKGISRMRYVYAFTIASIMLVSWLVGWQWDNNQMVTYQTGDGEKSKVILPDNSLIYLNAHSSVRVSKEWTTNSVREVWLEGEAYFDVEHSPSLGSEKFTVHTRDVSVEVLGTQFNVQETNGQTEVVLHTGKILLDVKKNKHRLLMNPGELVEVSKETAVIYQRQVNPEIYTAWKDNYFVFDNTTIEEIANLLETRYGTKVIFTDSSLMQRRFTFKMPDGNLDLLLKTIARSLDLNIVRTKEHIIIKPEVAEKPTKLN
jgi:ferric-dicitrate binding protein FerR (iron transport regulator)